MEQAAIGLALFIGQFSINPYWVALAAVCALLLGLLLRGKRRQKPSKQRYVMVDGSNVLYWKNERVDVAPLQDLVLSLTGKGWVPVLWFDANAGYLIADRYMGPKDLAVLFGVPEKQVHVAPKGTPADPLLLDGAKALKAQIISNDRFRDWKGSHPILHGKKRLVTGVWRKNGVELRGLRNEL